MQEPLSDSAWARTSASACSRIDGFRGALAAGELEMAAVCSMRWKSSRDLVPLAGDGAKGFFGGLSFPALGDPSSGFPALAGFPELGEDPSSLSRASGDATIVPVVSRRQVARRRSPLDAEGKVLCDETTKPL